PVGIDEGLRIELVQGLHELRAIGVASTTQASADGPEVVVGASQVFVARLQQCRVYDGRGTTRR
ncbi:pilus assembly protein FimV, partial [Pseudomonas aeruginosa]